MVPTIQNAMVFSASVLARTIHFATTTNLGTGTWVDMTAMQTPNESTDDGGGGEDSERFHDTGARMPTLQRNAILIPFLAVIFEISACT